MGANASSLMSVTLAWEGGHTGLLGDLQPDAEDKGVELGDDGGHICKCEYFFQLFA